MVLIMIVALIAQEPPTSRNLADSAAADAPAAEAASTPAAAGAAAADAASTPAAAGAAVAEAAPTSADADVAIAPSVRRSCFQRRSRSATRTVQVHPKCSLQYFDPDERNEVIIRWQQLGKYEDSQGRVWPCEMVAKQPQHPAVVLRDLNTKQQKGYIPNGTLVKVVGERDDEFVIVTEVTGIAKKSNFVEVWGVW
jgi:hypothetical protein